MKRKTMLAVFVAVMVMMVLCGMADGQYTKPILDFNLRQGSGTTIIDSASGIVGTTHGTVWSTDPSGRPVLYFDNPIVYWFGDGDHVEIPYHDALNSPHITIEIWVYPMSCGYYTVFAERIRDGATYHTITSLGLISTGYTTGTKPYFSLEVGGEHKSVDSPTDITLNEWHHIVGTYDGNDMKLYIDGEHANTTSGVGGPRDTGSNPFYIGHAPSSNHYFNGYYARFRMYDKALTAEEVAYNFRSHADLSCDDTNKSISPGGTAEYMITVKNTGNVSDTINLTLSPWPIPPSGWSYGLNKDNVTLLPSDSTEVILYVSDVLPHSLGDSWAVTVTGTAQGDPVKSDSITTTTTIEQLPPSVSISTDSFEYCPSDTMTISIDIANPTEDSITFQWYWGVPQFSVWVPVMSIPISAGYNDTLDFRFTIPDWGSTPFGNVFYVQLLGTGSEVLDADVTWWAYSPGGKATSQVDIAKEIKKTIERIG